jgi:hypothetical protein
MVVAFRDHLSNHLLSYTRAGEFVDADELLTEETAEQLAAPASSAPAAGESERFNEPRDLPHARHRDALVVLERNFGRYEEVYLTPLLRKLSEEIGEADGYDPKTLVADLEGAGAVRLERRKGMPYDYTVLLVNRAHPVVAAVREEAGGDYELDPADDDEYEYEDDFREEAGGTAS